MIQSIASLLLSTALLTAGAAATDAPSPLDVKGHWVTHDGDAVVTISECKDGAPCGFLTHVLVAHPDDDPQEFHDLAVEPLLSGFEKSRNQWANGRIFDPEAGREFRSVIKRVDADHLEVKGCVGPICRGMIWTRATQSTLDNALLGPEDRAAMGE